MTDFKKYFFYRNQVLFYNLKFFWPAMTWIFLSRVLGLDFIQLAIYFMTEENLNQIYQWKAIYRKKTQVHWTSICIENNLSVIKTINDPLPPVSHELYIRSSKMFIGPYWKHTQAKQKTNVSNRLIGVRTYLRITIQPNWMPPPPLLGSRSKKISKPAECLPLDFLVWGYILIR